MSAKINLLPDVRQAKLQDKQRRQLAISVAVGAVIVSAGLLVVGFLIIQGQNLRISGLTSSISSKKQQIASFPDVKKILGTQAKIAALPGLYSQRAIITKLLNTLSATEPPDVDFTALSLTSSSQLSLSMEGKSYLAAARVAKALEAANVTVGTGANTGNKPFFTNVQLSAVSMATNKTTYTITAVVSPEVISGQ